VDRGGLDLARGSVRVQLDDPAQTVLSGEKTAQLLDFRPRLFIEPWIPLTWWTSQWLGHPWYATTWYGDNWEGDNWEGCAVGGDAGDVCTYGGSFHGSEWYGAWD
jgi:hypothetical protein